MEQVIVGIVSLILLVVLYQERARRADSSELRGEIAETGQELRGEIAKMRQELRGEIAETRQELRGEIAETRQELRGEIAETRQELKEEMSRGFARTDRRMGDLTTSVIALAETVGQAKGRTETLKATG